MANRDFSDSVKLRAIRENLKANHGEICCALCGKKLASISECHFDHIFPFSRGGRSTEDNCQILCIPCNLAKNDKELQDFLLDEKARRFFAGEDPTQPKELRADVSSEEIETSRGMTKEVFDQVIRSFLSRKGDIHKVDFSRQYHHLPSYHYVIKYYGNLHALKKAFHLEDPSTDWNRETIKAALQEFAAHNGSVLQKDLTKENRLPSLPCVLSHYPEYTSFSDMKKNLLGLPVRSAWDPDSAIQAGKDFVKQHGTITERVLRAENGLPTSKIIYQYFGSLAAYQQAVGSTVTQKNRLISEAEIDDAVNRYFGDGDRTVDSMKQLFEGFPYSRATIHKRFGSYEAFCEKYRITVKQSKKAKYTKQEVDDAVAKWIKAGKPIPAAKELTRLGLPSVSVLLKYYENWKEPFILYQKLVEKLNEP